MQRITTTVIESVELPNRVKLQYVEQGDSSGIPWCSCTASPIPGSHPDFVELWDSVVSTREGGE